MFYCCDGVRSEKAAYLGESDDVLHGRWELLEQRVAVEEEQARRRGRVGARQLREV